jgi:tetratricopeptide (TPR) repeat protein
LQEDGEIVDTRNHSQKKPAWFAIGTCALVLAPLGLFGCSGTDTSEDTARAPIVLTHAEQVELDDTIDQSKQLLDNNAAQDSLTLLERSIEINPNSFAAHNNLCVAYGMMALRDKAVTECQRAVEIDPNIQLGKNNLNWVSSLQPAAPSQ